MPINPLIKSPKRKSQSESLAPTQLNRSTISSVSYSRSSRLIPLLDKRNLAIILTLLYTGLRCDEILSLTINNVDLINRTIFVHQSKGNKDRIVPIPDVLYPYIETYALLRVQTFFSIRSDFFFCGYKWAQLSPRNMRNVFYRIKNKLWFCITAHRFRHTYATELIRNNIDVYNVSKVLGHADIKTTQIYLSADVSRIADTINSVNLYTR